MTKKPKKSASKPVPEWAKKYTDMVIHNLDYAQEHPDQNILPGNPKRKRV